MIDLAHNKPIEMEGLRTYTLTITTAVLVVFLSHSTFVVSDAGKQRCSYNALISSFNRRAHEDGHRMYYECDADTGFYVEKMCGNGETFDARTLVRFRCADWVPCKYIER